MAPMLCLLYLDAPSRTSIDWWRCGRHFTHEGHELSEHTRVFLFLDEWPNYERKLRFVVCLPSCGESNEREVPVDFLIRSRKPEVCQ